MYLDSYDHSRCPGIGDFGGKGLANASRKAKSLKVGLLSFIWPLGTMNGLYFGFSLTGGGGPLLRNSLGDLGTMLGTCFMDFGGSMGPGALFPAAAFDGLSLRPFWSLRSVWGEVVKLLCSLRLKSEVSLRLLLLLVTTATLSYMWFCTFLASFVPPALGWVLDDASPLEQATEQ